MMKVKTVHMLLFLSSIMSLMSMFWYALLPRITVVSTEEIIDPTFAFVSWIMVGMLMCVVFLGGMVFAAKVLEMENMDLLEEKV